MRIAVWSHQVRTSYLQSGLGVDDSAVPAIGEVWEKVADGLRWQGQFDDHPREITGLGTVAQRAAEHAAKGRLWRPWVVARGRVRLSDSGQAYAKSEGATFAAIARAARSRSTPDAEPAPGPATIIIDLEPHYHGGTTPQFWRDDLGAGAAEVRALIAAYLGGGGQEIWLCVDARRYHLPPVAFAEWLKYPAVTRILPMTYWTDFKRPWRTSIDEAHTLLVSYGVALERIGHVFPANATRADMSAALQYSAAAGNARASVWQRLNLSRETADAIAALEDPWAPPAPLPPEEPSISGEDLRELRARLEAAEYEIREARRLLP